MKQFVVFSPIGFMVAASLLAIGWTMTVWATSKDDIRHPVAELNNCMNEQECRSYCDNREDPGIVKKCVAFAKMHNLLPRDEIARAEKFLAGIERGGPGGCKGEKQCVAYCDDPSHLNECLDFALRIDVIPPAERAQAEKVLIALRQGLKTPGGCAKKQECDSYCERPEHLEECLAFAEKAGLFPSDELAEAKKFVPLVARGETPGRCTSKAACDAYCVQDVHFDECVAFAERAALITPQEAELARKSKGNTPGKCRSLRECELFCSRSENRKICLDFAKEHGLVTQEEFEQADAFEEFQQCYDVAPAEIRSCLDETFGSELVSKMKQGIFPLEALLQNKVRSAKICVEKRFMEKGGSGKDLPPAVVSCMEKIHGKALVGEIQLGKLTCRDASLVLPAMRECIAKESSGRTEQCAAKPCAEMISCLQQLEKQGEGGRESLPPAVEEKLSVCVKEMESQQGQHPLDASTHGASGGDQGAPTSDAAHDQQYREQEKTTVEQYCPQFAAAPSCDYFGQGTDYYRYCKQCFPEK